MQGFNVRVTFAASLEEMVPPHRHGGTYIMNYTEPDPGIIDPPADYPYIAQIEFERIEDRPDAQVVKFIPPYDDDEVNHDLTDDEDDPPDCDDDAEEEMPGWYYDGFSSQEEWADEQQARYDEEFPPGPDLISAADY